MVTATDLNDLRDRIAEKLVIRTPFLGKEYTAYIVDFDHYGRHSVRAENLRRS